MFVGRGVYPRPRCAQNDSDSEHWSDECEEKAESCTCSSEATRDVLHAGSMLRMGEGGRVCCHLRGCTVGGVGLSLSSLLTSNLLKRDQLLTTHRSPSTLSAVQ